MSGAGWMLMVLVAVLATTVTSALGVATLPALVVCGAVGGLAGWLLGMAHDAHP